MRWLVLGLMISVGTASAAPHKKHKIHRATIVADAGETTGKVTTDDAPGPPQTGSVAPPAAPALDLTPPPARLESERPPRRWGMMGGGIALFAVSYAADAGFTYGFHHEPSGVSLIPLVGPLIQCGDKYGYQGPMPMTGNAAVDKQMADQIASANTLIQTVTYVGLAVDFVGQLTGLTLTLVGALTHPKPSSGSSVRVAATGRGLSVAF